MLTWEPSEEFLVAVQRSYQKDEIVDLRDCRGIMGRVIEPISPQEYSEVWAFRGYDSEASSLNPRFYYRCKRIENDSLGDTVPAGSDSALRGDQESAS